MLIGPDLILRCRVWERGAGITQRLRQSGACAAAVAAAARRGLTERRVPAFALDGGELAMDWRD